MSQPEEHVDPHPSTEDPRRPHLAPKRPGRDEERDQRNADPPDEPADSDAPDRPIVRPARRRPPPLIDPKPRPRR